MCGYNALLRIVGQIQAELYATRNKPGRVDLQTMLHQREEELSRYHEEWAERFEESKVPNGERGLLSRLTVRG